jgi:uncharacterized membrane protein
VRAIGRFIKATLVGGILFVVPFVVLAVLLREAVRLIADALHPVAKLFPTERVAGIVLVDLLALATIMALCFIAGMFVGTRPGRRVRDGLEELVLRHVPGFAFVRSLTHGLAGLEGEPGLSAALARFADAWVLAVVVERHAGGLCTVFVPSAPTPAAGAIYFMTEDRIKPLDVPVLSAMACILRLGVGSRKLFEGTAGAFAATASDTAPGANVQARIPEHGVSSS